MPGPGPGPAPWAGADGVARLPEALAGRSGRRLVRRIRRRLFVLLSLANVAGAAGVVATIIWALPGARIDDPSDAILVNGVLGALFLVLILPVGITWGELWLRSGRRWLQEERPPTEREVTAVLRAPVRLFLVHSTLWALATAAFTILNAWVEPGLMTRIGFTVGLGGLITSAFAYLLGERATRPLAAAALSIQSAARPRLPGVTTRALLGWALGTGVPLVGLTITAVFALTEGEVTARQLSVTVLVLSGTGLIVGMLAVVLSARAVAAPVASLRRGIGAVADGDLSARVEVYDGSVLGLLQAGFNDMAVGLQEREQLRDLYGRQVGEDVARGTLERGTVLGGECCEVAVIFVDVVGSTRIAGTRPPEVVVGLLNRFFAVVVDEVHAHGGWVNKFQGDATLVVFGAPVPLDDAADRALATARHWLADFPWRCPSCRPGSAWPSARRWPATWATSAASSSP